MDRRPAFPYRLSREESIMIDRRRFIRKGALAVLGGCAASPLSLLTACTKNGVSPFALISICQDSCTGCGECLSACEPGAIVLPKLSVYSIDPESCIDCGDCEEVCEAGAISIARKEYPLDPEKCVGCGKCMEVCENEGNAISWERDYYKVRGKCRADECQQECIAACEEDAISIVAGKAVIDLEKCTRCGACVGVCPLEAINPAHVEKDDSKCTNCGKCVEVCEFDAIGVIEPEEYHEPALDLDLCTRCGACVQVCGWEAIEVEKHTATIDQALCTGCELCMEACPFDAIKKGRR